MEVVFRASGDAVSAESLGGFQIRVMMQSMHCLPILCRICIVHPRRRNIIAWRKLDLISSSSIGNVSRFLQLVLSVTGFDWVPLMVSIDYRKLAPHGRFVLVSLYFEAQRVLGWSVGSCSASSSLVHLVFILDLFSSA